MAKSITTLVNGDKIKFGTYKVEGSTTLPIIWKVIDKNHAGYPANSVTVLTDKIVDLRGFDAKEVSNADTNRVSYGSNRYRTSNLRQWLNSGGAASAWFAAQNLTDGTANTNNHDATPADAGMSQPTGYSDIQGFMNNFTAQELTKMLNTTLTVAKNTITDGGASEAVTDKVFLLSNTEVGFANENSIAEGSIIAAVSANRIAYMTDQGFANTLSASKPASVGAAWYWWLRTPLAGYSYSARVVHSDGTLNSHYAYVGHFGVRPALNLTSDILVSDAVDVDGAYVVIYNSTPTISGTDSNLGTSVTSITRTYSVADTDVSDVLTVTEKVDGVTIRTISNAVRGQTYTADLASAWDELTLASHTLAIVVDDGKGGAATRTYTFTKTDDRIEFVLKNSIQTSAAARKIVVSGVLTVPAGATLTIKD